MLFIEKSFFEILQFRLNLLILIFYIFSDFMSIIRQADKLYMQTRIMKKNCEVFRIKKNIRNILKIEIIIVTFCEKME